LKKVTRLPPVGKVAIPTGTRRFGLVGVSMGVSLGIGEGRGVVSDVGVLGSKVGVGGREVLVGVGAAEIGRLHDKLVIKNMTINI
jgi:hypothetical protein